MGSSAAHLPAVLYSLLVFICVVLPFGGASVKSEANIQNFSRTGNKPGDNLSGAGTEVGAERTFPPVLGHRGLGGIRKGLTCVAEGPCLHLRRALVAPQKGLFSMRSVTFCDTACCELPCRDVRRGPAGEDFPESFRKRMAWGRRLPSHNFTVPVRFLYKVVLNSICI